MWILLLLLSITGNILLLSIHWFHYFDNVMPAFAVLNGTLLLVFNLHYRRAERRRHVLSFQNLPQESVLKSHSQRCYNQKQSLKQLHNKFHKAIHVLKHSNFVTPKKGNQALYDKPWFLLLGAKKAGKTALIKGSGLAFIDIDNHHDAEVALGDGLNSLFHFSSDAVFIESDGDYVTEGRAHDEWIALLKLLRHHRRNAPINGVILTIDITDFLLLTASQRNFRLMLFRERINEMIDYLGIIFPVYIVFSQCDKINGFHAYFSDLSASEKDQVFGTCLFTQSKRKVRPLTHMLRARLSLLATQLQRQIVDKLDASQSRNSKADVIAFYLQFEQALEPIGDFVENMLKGCAYKEQPFFAGVYFTSAGVCEHHFVKSDGSVFVKTLFKNLVLPLQRMVKANRSATRFRLSLKASFATSVIIGVVGGVSFMLSVYFSLQSDFAKNRLVIDDLVKAISTEAKENATLTQPLTLLRQRFLTLNKDANEFEYLLPYLALDEKRLMVKKEMERLYFHVLNLRIEQELQPLLRARMSALATQWEEEPVTSSLRNEYYNLLKLSLMLSCQVDRLDIPFATEQLVQLWLRSSEHFDSVDERSEVSDLVTTYLRAFNSQEEVGVSLQPWKSLKPTIDLARVNLAKPLTSDELYQMVRDDVPVHPALNINSIIPKRFQSYVESKAVVPWLYSQAGWEYYVKKKLKLLQQEQRQSEGDWVLAQEISEAKLQLNTAMLADKVMYVKSRYFDDYARFWFNFVESIRYSRLNNFEGTQATLNALASPNGLFTELVSNMAKQLYLFKVDSDGGQALTRIKALSVHFPILNQLHDFHNKSRNNAMFTQFQRNMLRVNKDLFTIISSYSIQDAALTYTGNVLDAHQTEGGKEAPGLYKAWYDTQALLARFSTQSSIQLTYLLTEPLRQSWKHLFAQSRVALESKWQQQVYSYFQRSISERYPFTVLGADVSLSQLSQFFNRQNGLLWQFVTQDLAPFINDFKQQKKEREWLGLSLGIDFELVDALRDADVITSGFFNGHSEQPLISYQIMPTAKKSILESYLHINGYEYRYRNEPEEWRRFVWPSRQNTHQATINAVSSETGHVATLDINSDWALFKLIDRAKVSPLSVTDYRLRWDLQTRRGELLISDYKIKVKPSNLLFKRQKLHNFMLPSRLFKQPELELISSTLDILPVDN